MKQFFEMKKKHPDAIMLYRVGDFYETFSTDAVTASEILGITLTKRANGPGQHIELAGFPHHALDTYLPKLVRAGKRVAICEQLEDPKLTKKLVKRGITELVTPGVAINGNMLDYRENNFLGAVHFGKNACGVAFLDISTGEFLTAEGTIDYIDKLLANFSPKEVLVERSCKKRFDQSFTAKYLTFELDDWMMTGEAAHDRLLKQFETKNLKGFGVDKMHNAIVASGAILFYLDLTQHTQISHITSLARIEEEKFVRLDRFTVRNLELVEPMCEDGKSLLNVIDRTVCPMGARLLRRWTLFPLKSVKQINDRLDVVEHFFKDREGRELIQRQLELVGEQKTQPVDIRDVAETPDMRIGFGIGRPPTHNVAVAASEHLYLCRKPSKQNELRIAFGVCRRHRGKPTVHPVDKRKMVGKHTVHSLGRQRVCRFFTIMIERTVVNHYAARCNSHSEPQPQIFPTVDPLKKADAVVNNHAAAYNLVAQ